MHVFWVDVTHLAPFVGFLLAEPSNSLMVTQSSHPLPPHLRLRLISHSNRLRYHLRSAHYPKQSHKDMCSLCQQPLPLSQPATALFFFHSLPFAHPFHRLRTPSYKTHVLCDLCYSLTFAETEDEVYHRSQFLWALPLHICQGHSHPKLSVAQGVGSKPVCRLNTTHRS